MLTQDSAPRQGETARKANQNAPLPHAPPAKTLPTSPPISRRRKAPRQEQEQAPRARPHQSGTLATPHTARGDVKAWRDHIADQPVAACPREETRPNTWLVMPIYPSGHGAVALTGAHSSAPRDQRRTPAARSRAKGMGSYRGWVTRTLTHPRLPIVSAARPLSSKTALTGTRTAASRPPHPRQPAAPCRPPQHGARSTPCPGPGTAPSRPGDARRRRPRAGPRPRPRAGTWTARDSHHARNPAGRPRPNPVQGKNPRPGAWPTSQAESAQNQQPPPAESDIRSYTGQDSALTAKAGTFE